VTNLLLVLTLYCGQPVSVTLSYEEGTNLIVKVFEVRAAEREQWLNAAKQIEAVGAGQVGRIEADKLLGMTCGKTF